MILDEHDAGDRVSQRSQVDRICDRELGAGGGRKSQAAVGVEVGVMEQVRRHQLRRRGQPLAGDRRKSPEPGSKELG